MIPRTVLAIALATGVSMGTVGPLVTPASAATAQIGIYFGSPTYHYGYYHNRHAREVCRPVYRWKWRHHHKHRVQVGVRCHWEYGRFPGHRY
jgi:hypothetical protein